MPATSTRMRSPRASCCKRCMLTSTPIPASPIARPNSHTTARNAAEMLRLHRVSKMELHLRAGLRACDWLAKVQEPNGAIQWKFVDSTGEPESPLAYAAVTAEALAAWALAFEATADERYLEAGRKLAGWVTRDVPLPPL